MIKKLIIFSSITLLLANFAVGDEGHHDMHSDVMQQEEELGICPVMHNPAVKEHSYTYEGKDYYFCCPACVESFKKDPEKYISKIKEINIQAL